MDPTNLRELHDKYYNDTKAGKGENARMNFYAGATAAVMLIVRGEKTVDELWRELLATATEEVVKEREAKRASNH